MKNMSLAKTIEMAGLVAVLISLIHVYFYDHNGMGQAFLVGCLGGMGGMKLWGLWMNHKTEWEITAYRMATAQGFDVAKKYKPSAYSMVVIGIALGSLILGDSYIAATIFVFGCLANEVVCKSCSNHFQAVVIAVCLERIKESGGEPVTKLTMSASELVARASALRFGEPHRDADEGDR